MASNYVDDLIDDDEVPELTEEDAARMIPFAQLPKDEQQFLLQLKHATIRPDPPPPVEEVTLKLSRPVLERLRATGSGWEDRVDEVLAQWLDRQKAS
jgi:uncharacterized protein (DUF4415 family)